MQRTPLHAESAARRDVHRFDATLATLFSRLTTRCSLARTCVGRRSVCDPRRGLLAAPPGKRCATAAPAATMRQGPGGGSLTAAPLQTSRSWVACARRLRPARELALEPHPGAGARRCARGPHAVDQVFVRARPSPCRRGGDLVEPRWCRPLRTASRAKAHQPPAPAPDAHPLPDATRSRRCAAAVAHCGLVVTRGARHPGTLLGDA